MRNAKAWGVSIALHSAIAAAFFVSFSFRHELLKKDDSKEEQKLQIESVFTVASNETPMKNQKPDAKTPRPKEQKNEMPKKEEMKEQKEAPIKTTQNAQLQKASAQEVKKEEASNNFSPPVQKKSSYSENDKKQFLATVKQAIKKHIIYPEAARRRNIQGDVEVDFVLLPNGSFGNIRITSGHSVFHRAVIDAIERTKVTPPSSMPLPLELSFTLTFELDNA